MDEVFRRPNLALPSLATLLKSTSCKCLSLYTFPVLQYLQLLSGTLHAELSSRQAGPESVARLFLLPHLLSPSGRVASELIKVGHQPALQEQWQRQRLGRSRKA